MPEFTWTAAPDQNEMSEALAEVMDYMSAIDCSEQIATQFSMSQDTIREHLDGPVKAMAERWEQDDDPRSADMNGMYMAGLLVGTLLERKRTKTQS